MIPLGMPPPDLLKRFVATPFKFIAHGFTIETNDLDLLEQFDQRDQLNAFAAVASDFRIRVIREATDPANASEEVRTICAESSCAVLVGMDTIILVDREQRRVFAFVARDLPQERFAHQLLPSAIRHAESHPHVTEMQQKLPPSSFQSLQTSDKSDNRV